MTRKNKKRILFIVVLVFLLSFGSVYFLFLNKKKIVYSTVKAQVGNIVQTVNQTGVLKSENEIDLSFANSGKINNIAVKVGDKVKSGQVLAELDFATLNIKKQEASAGLEVTKSNLKKLLSGATSQDIAIAQANVSQAQKAHDATLGNFDKIKKTVNENINQAQKTLNDLESKAATNVTPFEQAIVTAQLGLDNNKIIYQKDIDNSIKNALVVVGDKLNIANNSLDVLNTTINDEDADGLISVKNGAYLTNTKSGYINALNYLNKAKESLIKTDADKSNGNVQTAVEDCWSVLNEINRVLQNCFSALENSITSVDFTQADLDILKAGINKEQSLVSASILTVQQTMQNLDNVILNYNTKISVSEDILKQAQTNYNDAINKAKNSLTIAKVSGEQQIATAKSAVDSALETGMVAKAQLAKVLAPANKNDIDLLSLQIKQAEAVFNSVVKQIDDNKIKSPIDAIITKIDCKIGEQIGMGKTAIVILGENNFKIEVLVSEADISKIKVGQNALITLDSYGENVKFNGIVNFIEPAETVIQEVVYYKTIVLFTDQDISYTIKSGMTANVTVSTNGRENVLMISSRAVLDKNNDGKYVRVLTDNQEVVEKEIKLGISGDDGLVEVLSGISAGDSIITKITEN